MVTRNWTARLADGRMSARLFRRTTLPIMAVGIILLAAGVYGAWRVHRLQKRGSDILSDNVASIRAAEELETIVRELRYRLKRYLSTEDPRHLDEMAALLPDAGRWLDEASELAKTTREQQLVERIRRGHGRFVQDLSEMRDAGDAELRAQLGLSLADEVIPNKLLVHTGRYIELNEQELARSSERNQATANRLMFGLILLGTCGGVAGLLAGYLIARRVSRTIVQLSLPIRDTAGKLNEVVGPVSVAADPGFKDLESMLQTVSHRVSAVVERLQASEHEKLRAEQMAAVGQLAAGLAHELRNPLTSVKTILQLARTPDELTHRDLEVLDEEVVRLEQSVQTFLDFARPPQPEKRELDLRDVIHQTIELVSRRAEQQAIRLECRTDAEPVPAVADATQLRQVVLNLLLNAFDAVPPGGTVCIAAYPEHAVPVECGVPAPGAWGVVQVRDNGEGLPASLQDRIFEPFVSTKETGTGLGLSICKRIVDVHGGTIYAEDRPGGGAVFTVRLPLAASIAQPDVRFEDRLAAVSPAAS